jgi:hypothetical protein
MLSDYNLLAISIEDALAAIEDYFDKADELIDADNMEYAYHHIAMAKGIAMLVKAISKRTGKPLTAAHEATFQRLLARNTRRQDDLQEYEETYGSLQFRVHEFSEDDN